MINICENTRTMASISTQILIAGAGVTGLGIAWDACLRGMKVLVVEQADIGEGTTGRFHGLLHSGGRYVTSDPLSARECAAENATLRRIVPHAIEDTGGMFIATPADPVDFPDRWKAASETIGLPFEEVSTATALSVEPNINPRSSRVFRVQDGSIDSFDLTHALVSAIRRCGGRVLLRHRLESLHMRESSFAGAEVKNLATGEILSVGADFLVNAAGPWAAQVARLADIHIPITLGKGVMIAISQRLTHTVVNRCRPPDNGDILVPVGTVSVLGTTDTQVKDAEDLAIDPSEVDLLLAEGDVLIPGLAESRAMRAWSGIRAFYQPERNFTGTRGLSRAHAIVDHEGMDGFAGMVSILGGKLTTFRLIAEEAVNLLSTKLGIDSECTTQTALITPAEKSYYGLPDMARREAGSPASPTVICECEGIPADALMHTIGDHEGYLLDDLRRDLRLGMGPCQASFCAIRASEISSRMHPSTGDISGLSAFLIERWKGNSPLAWGATLRQMELQRRIYQDLLGFRPDQES
jgi:glycerol-3-phosphate dehydrogenase